MPILTSVNQYVSGCSFIRFNVLNMFDPFKIGMMETHMTHPPVGSKEDIEGMVILVISIYKPHEYWLYINIISVVPIGSMYPIYGNMDPINIPQMLAYIPAPWILWDMIYCVYIPHKPNSE